MVFIIVFSVFVSEMVSDDVGGKRAHFDFNEVVSEFFINDLVIVRDEGVGFFAVVVYFPGCLVVLKLLQQFVCHDLLVLVC
jgi:hypothetical protein